MRQIFLCDNSIMSTDYSILQSAQKFLDQVLLSRSANTARTYRNGIASFLEVLAGNHLPPQETSVSLLTEDAVGWFSAALKKLAPTTERLYLTVVSNFFEYLVAEKLADLNLPRMRLLIRQRARRPSQRLPQFPASDIDRVIASIQTLSNHPGQDATERLRVLRDRAFLLTLADTGLRVHEACNLRRGDIDWNEGRALVIGKGDREAVVRFSQRSLEALKTYILARAQLDGISGRPMSSLALFARHDKGAGKKVKPITTATGRNIVALRVKEALGEAAVGSITPHSFRHYFVTRVLQASGNLKLAQELARHKNIAVTQRYAHLSNDELDQGYWQVFEDQE